MNIGLDIGYSATKTITGEGRRAQFPSAVGTPDEAHFSLNGNENIILEQPSRVQIGAGAILQSRFIHRREDRHWIESPEWYALAAAAWTELSTGTRVNLEVVTGLPVAFFSDKETVSARLLGRHTVQRQGRHAQTFEVTRCTVIPQPFGALLAETLDDRGRIVDRDLATGTVGIIDIGGKTTNLLSVNRLAEINQATDSVDVGAWDIVRALRDWLGTRYPGLEELRDHQVINAVVHRSVKYYGEIVDLSAIVTGTLEPMADQVIAQASQLWNGAATLDGIIVAGGGAILLGTYIQRAFRHARVADDPVFANALGFYRFCQRLSASNTA
jgi:plasmid segregation protein ParM